MSEQQDDQDTPESVPPPTSPPVTPPPTPVPDTASNPVVDPTVAPAITPPDSPDSPDSEPSVVVVELSKSDKDMAMWAHVSGLAGLIGIPSFVGPLIIYLMKKDESEYIAMEAREALNFQISMTIYLLISAMLCYVCIGLLVLPVVMLVWLVFTIIASIKASEGIPYRYPLTIRMVS